MEQLNEVASELAKMGLFGVAYSLKGNDVYVSLRSIGEDPFDVSRVAKIFGGGGHKTSAGCQLTLDEWIDFFEVCTHIDYEKQK